MKSDMINLLKKFYYNRTGGNIEKYLENIKCLELEMDINVDKFKCLSSVSRINDFVNEFVDVSFKINDNSLYFARTLARYYTTNKDESVVEKNNYEIESIGNKRSMVVSKFTGTENGQITMYENFRNTVKPFKHEDTHSNFLKLWNVKTNKRVLLTHGSNCNDGMGVFSVVAIYCVEKNLLLNTTLFLDHKNINFNAILEECIDAVVFIGDFSFKKEQIKKLKEVAKMVVVVDHHDSAMNELIEEKNAFIDKAHSGAVLAHLFFNVGEPIPLILELIEDRDLYTFLYGDLTNAVMHAIINNGKQYINENLWSKFSIPSYVKKDVVNTYIKNIIIGEPDKILNGGAKDYLPIVEKERLKNEEHAKNAVHYLFGNVRLVGLNFIDSPSDVLNIASRENECGAFSYKFITVNYENSKNEKKSFDAIDFSFRSYSDKIPVNTLCELLGGGGHPQAAGACINISSLMLKSFFSRQILVKYKMSDKDREIMYKLVSIIRSFTKNDIKSFSNNLYTNNDLMEIIVYFGINVKDMFEISKDNINILHLKIKPTTERTKEILSNFGY